MQTTSTPEIILKYVTDMAAAEHLLAHALKAQENDADLKHFPEAQGLISRIRSVSERHLTGLEAVARTLGGEARSNFKEAVTAVTGAALGAVGHLRTHNVSKMLRDDYTALSLNSIGYSMLHTTGIALDSTEISNLALSYLKETAGLIMELSQAVVPVVVAELAETLPVEPAASATAKQNILQAWRSH